MPGFGFSGFFRIASHVAVAASLLLVAGCAGDYYPTKSDARPHPGVARALTLPVHGIDVARYQGNIDWHAVKAAGTKFAFIKATEGGDYIDPMFATNWAGARAAGVPRGAYHFVFWCRPAHEQAQWFIQHIPQDRDALPPVLDLEWNTSSRTCPQKVDKATAIEKARLMLRELEQHTGKRPIIYTDITFHREVLAGEAEFDRYPFWLRSVAAEPHERYHARRWMFWQFTATGRVPGIRGDVDRNAFYGTEREWNDFVQTDCDPRDRHHHEHATRCGGTSPRQAFAPTTRPTAVGEAAPTPGAAKPAGTSTPAGAAPVQVPEPEQKPGEAPVDLDDPPVTSTLPRTTLPGTTLPRTTLSPTSPLTQSAPKPARPAVATR